MLQATIAKVQATVERLEKENAEYHALHGPLAPMGSETDAARAQQGTRRRKGRTVLNEAQKKVANALRNARRRAKRTNRAQKRYKTNHQQRKRKDLDKLKYRGAQYRLRVQTERRSVFPESVGLIQARNKTLGMRRRITGDPKLQARYGILMGRNCTREEMRHAMKGEKFSALKQAITKEFLKKVGETLSAADIQKGLDLGGGSNKCWQHVFAEIEKGFKAQGLSIRGAIPCPHEQRQMRGVMNEKFEAMGAYSVEGETRQVKNKDTKQMEEEKMGPNMWMRTNMLLTTLVHLYGITEAEAKAESNGKLKVALKLDETVWAGDKKMERLTVTLMNRALNGKDANDLAGREWFQVQSETEIWPVGMFEVGKEDHAVLKWHLQASDLNECMKRHNQGEKLKVQFDDGSVHTFEVEWHLAGDLKTLKCCAGVKNGAMCEHACLFCMTAREKKQNPATNKTKSQWMGGLKASRPSHQIGKAPTRDKEDPGWDCVFDIPLERIHICTMHGENRIVEKLVHLHIVRVWNMKEGAQRRKRILAIEKLLYEDLQMRLGGQQYRIVKCEKLSGKMGDVPMKPSFNDMKARKFTRVTKEVTLGNVSVHTIPLRNPKLSRLWDQSCQTQHRYPNREGPLIYCKIHIRE
jgi:hypothetical protein